MRDKLVDALLAHFESQRASSVATLEVYLHNPAGIGEHPQVVEEMTKQVKSLSEAEDCLKVLNKHFVND